MILTGRVGQDTVGKVYYPLPILENSIASDNIIRLVINDKNERLYTFGFLSSRIGKEIIRKRKTGVGQPFITEDMLSNIPIPELDENSKNKIIENIGQYIVKFNGALENELKAIDLIEKEIESWQKS
jgi:type I restriction enzyme S subunit